MSRPELAVFIARDELLSGLYGDATDEQIMQVMRAIKVTHPVEWLEVAAVAPHVVAGALRSLVPLADGPAELWTLSATITVAYVKALFRKPHQLVESLFFGEDRPPNWDVITTRCPGVIDAFMLTADVTELETREANLRGNVRVLAPEAIDAAEAFMARVRTHNYAARLSRTLKGL